MQELEQEITLWAEGWRMGQDATLPLFQMAVRWGYVHATQALYEQEITLTVGHETYLVDAPSVLRTLLHFLSGTVDSLRFPEAETLEVTQYEVQIARRELDEFYAEAQPEILADHRFLSMMAEVDAKNEKERQMGIERVNPYGFELILSYPLDKDESVPIYVKSSNGLWGLPHYLTLKRVDDEL